MGKMQRTELDFSNSLSAFSQFTNFIVAKFINLEKSK